MAGSPCPAFAIFGARPAGGQRPTGDHTDRAAAPTAPLVATGLVDVTDDLAALDHHGRWVVVIDFEGRAVCARFETWTPLTPATWSATWARLAPDPWRGIDPHSWTSSLDRQSFGDGVRAIRDAIAAGDVYQVNLTRRLSAPLEHPWASAVASLGRELADRHPAPHAATVVLPEHGVAVASASPERFLTRDGDRIWSSPIKGTAVDPSGLTAKDRAENVMIVDLVRNDLGRVCEYGSVRVPSLLAVESHPGLVHLVSTVEGKLRGAMTWPQVLAATFAPGSVTGAPKLAAIDRIDTLEPLPRGTYCGTVGWVDADRRQADLNVAIRTFWAEGGMLHLGTGGAITYDSTPEDEWNETELKAHRLLAVAATPTTPNRSSPDRSGSTASWSPPKRPPSPSPTTV